MVDQHGQDPNTSCSSWGFSAELTVLKVLVGTIRKFNSLNNRILGKVTFAMPARLSGKSFAMIDMPFLEWCETHELSALVLFFRTSISISGYGYLDRLPTYYALVFVRPAWLNGVVQLGFQAMAEQILGTSCETLKPLIREVTDFFVGGHAPAITNMYSLLPEGWQKIWEVILQKDALDVRLNIEITEIDRQLHDEKAPAKPVVNCRRTSSTC